MSTAIGPQGPNFTTSRPAHDAEASGGVDSWAKNCSQAGAQDGTFLSADFFNVIIAQLREAIRQAGVTLDNTNDEMLYEAIQAIAEERALSILATRLSANRGLRITESPTGHYVVQSNLGLGARSTPLT